MRPRAEYRSQMDIFASVLETAANTGDIGITKMAYLSKLSYKQIRMHIEPLLKGHLLVEHDKFYSITEKGREFLRLYDLLTEMINDDPLPVLHTNHGIFSP